VISASGLGKVKTAIQVAMVLVLISVHGTRPLWVSLLVYATVIVTILSGADYFFGVRRSAEAGSATRASGA
jgi:CDP-diacylglycerol--glycerol-3-phosphate 3-phosphatidyltransferase